MSLPEVHLAGGTCAEALRLVPVALAMREQGLVNPVLLAAGPDPTAVARTYIACGLAADVTLPAATDLAAAIRRYDQLWAARTPAAVSQPSRGPSAAARRSRSMRARTRRS